MINADLLRVKGDNFSKLVYVWNESERKLPHFVVFEPNVSLTSVSYKFTTKS